MVEVHRSWGKRLKQRRQAIGLTQQGLADICGVRQSTISRIEAGTVCPRDSAKWLLAGALGTTVEELFPYPAVVPPFPEAPTTKAS